MLYYYKLLKIYFIHGPKIFFFISFKTTTTTAVTTHTHTKKQNEINKFFYKFNYLRSNMV
jgi:hypothetical protein